MKLGSFQSLQNATLTNANFPFVLNNVVLHAYRYLIGVNSQLSRIFILKLPKKATPDSKQRQYEIVTPKIVAAKALDNAGHIHNPALLYNPKNLAVSKDGHIFILDEVAKLPGVDANVTARVKTINLKGQSVNFYKDSSGNAINYINLKEETRSITYLDISVETQNYMYILAYLGDGSSDEDYVVDVYDPTGAHLSRTTGVVAGKLTVDKWRSIYTLNYQTISGENGVTEPTISEWIPSIPEG